MTSSLTIDVVFNVSNKLKKVICHDAIKNHYATFLIKFYQIRYNMMCRINTYK